MSDTSVHFERIDDDHWYHMFKLPDEFIEYFWKQIEIAKQENNNANDELVGNISRSLHMKDPDNIIIDKIFRSLYFSPYQKYFNQLVERTFRMSDYGYVETPSSPSLKKLWVNFQKKYEFNPLHDHSGLFSFVIWMKIPYNLEDEKNLDFVKHSKSTHSVGNFVFVPPGMNLQIIDMEKDIEGCCAVFPAYFHHMVYPFYTSDEERITISGNIFFDRV